MDEQSFLKACQLRDNGALKEAIEEFCRIAKETSDPIDKAGVLLNAATTLKILGECNLARMQLKAARDVIISSDDPPSKLRADYRLALLNVRIEFEDADISSFEGNITEALARFDLLLTKYEQELKEPDLRECYEMIQARRGFILADLGRNRDALPILQEAESFKGRQAEIRFYLGHCYLAIRDYSKALEWLNEAIGLGLPRRLEYRANCELGIAYYNMKNYAQAKLSFEKSVEKADTEYIQQAQIWKWLQNSSRLLGLNDEADRYSKLGRVAQS